MRAFVAIELPEETRKAVAALQEKLRATGADVKWVEVENIHLTMKFLGEIGDELRARVCAAIGEVAAANPSFHAKLSLIGAFPNIDYPRVVWLGVSDGEAQLKKMARELEDGLSKLGIAKEERAFQGHITIGRVRSPAGKKKLTRAMAEISPEFLKQDLNFPVTKITLFKSSLSPKGPVYEAQDQKNLTIS